MTTYAEKLRTVWHRYEEVHGRQPATTRAAVEWGVRKHLIDVPHIDPLDVLAGDMAAALRTEQAYDEHGRAFRRNHAVRGPQLTIWASVEMAEPGFMQESFEQRRNQIIADCRQLKRDVDGYNAVHAGTPLQMSFDFTQDVMRGPDDDDNQGEIFQAA